MKKINMDGKMKGGRGDVQDGETEIRRMKGKKGC